MRSFFLIAAILLAHVSWGQDLSKVNINTTKVSENIYMLQGGGGNIALFYGRDGILMVDSQVLPLAENVAAAIFNIQKAPIKFLINTSWYEDNTGGNSYFGKNALIIAHDSVKMRLSKEQTIPFFNKTIKPAPVAAHPTISTWLPRLKSAGDAGDTKPALEWAEPPPWKAAQRLRP